MRLRLCTWNVNSVRLRVEQIARLVDEQAPDVLCMQEIKCQEGEFPREAVPEPEKLFSWWSYRAADFRKSNRGLRLDHILVTPGLREAAFRTGAVSSRVHDDVREWTRPSDHAPVTADLAI